MHTIYISIGSNIEPRRYIKLALVDLEQAFSDLVCSSFYESEAVGFDGDNFINAVLEAKTTDTIPQVVKTLHAIEAKHGRQRSGPKFSSRTIDLDLLLYDDDVYVQDNIHLPRDEILINAFVLQPLAELAPQREHPIEKQSYANLWQAFDQSSQSLWVVNL